MRRYTRNQKEARAPFIRGFMRMSGTELIPAQAFPGSEGTVAEIDAPSRNDKFFLISAVISAAASMPRNRHRRRRR